MCGRPPPGWMAWVGRRGRIDRGHGGSLGSRCGPGFWKRIVARRGLLRKRQETSCGPSPRRDGVHRWWWGKAWVEALAPRKSQAISEILDFLRGCRHPGSNGYGLF